MSLLLLLVSLVSATTCNDGSHSNSVGRGTCSHHGGVMSWDDYSPPTYVTPKYVAPRKPQSNIISLPKGIDNGGRYYYAVFAESAGASPNEAINYKCFVENNKVVENISIYLPREKWVVSDNFVATSEDTSKFRVMFETTSDVRLSYNWVWLVESERFFKIPDENDTRYLSTVKQAIIVINDSERIEISLVGFPAAIARAWKSCSQLVTKN